MIGRKLANFQINERLGEGGMGTVYRATDLTLNRAVAIKMLHPFLVNNPDSFKRFQNEAHLSARISHPNVATLFNFQEFEANHFIVMEYVKGLALDDVLKLQGNISERETIKIGLQVLEGLGAAHELGIMHRDLKPGNIMITHRGFVKLMDFGIARLEHAERMTRQNSVIGTLEYLAPELVRGEAPSHASDLYALGVMLHEMLSGHTLYAANSEASLMYQIAHKPPTIQLSGINRSLVQVIKKLTHKQLSRRYQNTQQVIRDLEKIYPGGKVDPRLISQKLTASPGLTKAPLDVKGLLPKLPVALLKKVSLPFDLDLRILAGAALFCLVILILGMNRGSREEPSSETEQEDPLAITETGGEGLSDQRAYQSGEILSQQNEPGSIAFIEKYDTDNTPANTKEREVSERKAGTSERKELVEKEAKQTPVKRNKPTPKAEDVTERTQRVAKPEPSERKSESIDRGESAPSNTVEEEVVPTPPQPENKPKGKVRLRIPDTFLSASLSERLTSENTREGQIVYLNTTSPVYQGEYLVIPRGAKIKAIIKKVRRSDGRKKAFLAFELQAVQTVDGQWLTVSYPEYSNLSRTKVIFNKGLRLNRIKLKSTNITLNY